jgi:putative acyl-CoA dehydrogenase
VICLDILRALAKEPDTIDAVVQELHAERGSDPRLDTWLEQTEANMTVCLKSGLNNGGSEAQIQARRLAEQLALALQAVLMARHSPAAMADAFIASRLMGDHGQTFGTLGPALNLAPILDSATARLKPA